MENRLQNLIISAQLTPKEKEVADYVLENLQKCCFMTSTELAGELNVSYSSVIRLTKTLGFTGYPDFQNFLRETYAEQSRDVDTGILIPAERIEAIKKKSTRQQSRIRYAPIPSAIYRAPLPVIPKNSTVRPAVFSSTVG